MAERKQAEERERGFRRQPAFTVRAHCAYLQELCVLMICRCVRAQIQLPVVVAMARLQCMDMLLHCKPECTF